MDKDNKKLSDLENYVFHEGGTERPFTGEYWDHTAQGAYACKNCGQILFKSGTKLDSSVGPIGLQGWPAFSEAIPGTIKYQTDNSLGIRRTEALCANCGIHLGHVFDDVEGHGSKHYCVNSCTLDFEPQNKE